MFNSKNSLKVKTDNIEIDNYNLNNNDNNNTYKFNLFYYNKLLKNLDYLSLKGIK